MSTTIINQIRDSIDNDNYVRNEIRQLIKNTAPSDNDIKNILLKLVNSDNDTKLALKLFIINLFRNDTDTQDNIREIVNSDNYIYDSGNARTSDILLDRNILDGGNAGTINYDFNYAYDNGDAFSFEDRFRTPEVIIEEIPEEPDKEIIYDGGDASTSIFTNVLDGGSNVDFSDYNDVIDSGDGLII